jgi:hypothetical protein
MNIHFTTDSKKGEFLIPIFHHSDGRMEGLTNVNYIPEQQEITDWWGLQTRTEFVGGNIRIFNPLKSLLRVTYAVQTPNTMQCGNEVFIPPGHWSTLRQYPGQTIHLMGLARLEDPSERYFQTISLSNSSSSTNFGFKPIDYLMISIGLAGLGFAVRVRKSRKPNNTQQTSSGHPPPSNAPPTEIFTGEIIAPQKNIYEDKNDEVSQLVIDAEIIEEHRPPSTKNPDASQEELSREESISLALNIFKSLSTEEQERILREISKQIGERKNLEDALRLLYKANPNNPEDFMRVIKRLNRKVRVPNSIKITSKADIQKYLNSLTNHAQSIHSTLNLLKRCKNLYKFVVWKKIPFYLIGHLCHEVNNKSIHLKRELNNISYETVLSNLSYWTNRIEEVQKDYERLLYYVDQIGYPSKKIKKFFMTRFYPRE